MFKSPCKITDSAIRRDKYISFLARSLAQPLWKSLVYLSVIAVGNSFSLDPLVAAPLTAPTTIENQATGSFTDGEDPVAQPELIFSNIVKVTVAEVAGITVSSGVASEAPSSVASAGAFQGDGTINAGDIAFFDYVITNAGNDPTQFFIPGAPSSITGGTFDATTNPIQIIAYNPTGTSDIPVTGVTVPASGQRTGPDGTATPSLIPNKNGIIPAGGTVTIRVPIKVNATAAVNSTISVTMGNTPTPLGTNQVYTNNSNLDIYTQDNPDGTTDAGGTVIETAGMPINGDTTNHRQESSNIGTTTIVIEPINITGKVFEDVNYGGGAGRDLTTSTGITRPNVRVELYAADGTYLGATLTDATGKYKFNQFNVTPATAFTSGKSYQVRVVNSFVTSSRSGGCDSTTATLTTAPTSCTQSPVQTFRTLGDTDANSIADPDLHRVGGELPAKLDADSNLTSQNLSALTVGTKAVESLTTVTLGTAALSGVDFGYNFDTIVNTNDSGQGSLRQFITNSNALTNTGLAQVGQTTGKEVSIFMVPKGSASPGILGTVPSQLTNGVAIITVGASELPAITDPNTTIDGTTQTTNVGDTNAGVTGTGGTVGTSANNLSQVNKPEVEINDGISGSTSWRTNGILVHANNTTVRGMAIWGFGWGSQPMGDIHVGPLNGVGNCSASDVFTGLLFEQNVLGTTAAGFNAANTNTTGNEGRGFESSCGSQGIFRNNLLGFTKYVAGGWNDANNVDPNMNWVITNNEFRSAGHDNLIDNVSFENNAHNILFTNNLVTGSYANGISLYDNVSSGNIKIDNNTITNSGFGSASTEWAGIAIFTGTNGDVTISKNIIQGNKGAGVWVEKDFSGVKITQNSMFGNGGLGIDLKGTTLDNGSGNQTILSDTVTPNDGSKTVANIANLGMDYPIMTAASVSVVGTTSTLTIKGYVGNVATGSTTFKDAKIEFFVGAADTNDKGRVFSTDPTTVSKLHAEGQTYLGTCTADANGLFGTTAQPCAFTVPTGTDTRNITSTATDPAGNTSEFSAAVASDPNVLLVKRITAINGLAQQPDGSLLNTYVHFNTYDDNTISIPTQATSSDPQKDTDKWPNAASGFLLGAVDGGNVAPNSSIEYTIYFLSTGESDAKNVLFCDRVPGNVTFIPNAYNHIPSPTPSTNPNRGIVVQIGTTLTAYESLDSSYAKYFPPGVEPSGLYPTAKCGGANTNGAVVVNLGNIPQATASGVPPESYGFVRFKGRVK